MLDDAERRRVQARFHELALNWDAAKQNVPKETPMDRVNRLAEFYRKTPVVASPALLKSAGFPKVGVSRPAAER